ncbi:MAG: methionine--tRNA ligase subunit beta [Candidatus Ryanbacteria bacterium RIFCSPHIGHO2_02_FULL_45_13b]|uniref:Methionine--tRNA ligase n=1 Tax=Candidatus Ryanbacteria bacterium RIFCSPHIGHO2_02_FULL_45_13b TaxID=1802117 RepID=A0A1G2G8L4_9BACT|nr:MAG: methionine--tRNA ligase subunit beta [Candidatus Ryanbacteria bacterium RIFCSPHIGHO2_02_FULL_45_13b]
MDEYKQEQKTVSYDNFSKLDLRVARVANAERVSGSEKLLRLEVDMGDGTTRQIIAGIGKAYTPETLTGKEIIVVANLEPRMLMGLESQGMLLAARDAEGMPVLLSTEKDTSPGSKIN